jgi:hypothetical protein
MATVMIRAIALIGVYVVYRGADAICRQLPAAPAWVRAWVPPLVLLVGCVTWMKQWPLPPAPRRRRWAWIVRLAVAASGCASVLLAVAASAPSFGSAPSWPESAALITLVLHRCGGASARRQYVGPPGARGLVGDALFGVLPERVFPEVKRRALRGRLAQVTGDRDALVLLAFNPKHVGRLPAREIMVPDW